MGYQKIITYGDNLEIYQYELVNRTRSISRRIQTGVRNQGVALSRQVTVGQEEQNKGKRADNARRAGSAFRRLVSANLGQFDVPVLASFTYAENVISTEQGHQDFNTFIRTMRNVLGQEFRYIAVPEFQKRGAIHFHALFWDLPPGLVETERNTRFFAKLWQRGYVDLTNTDGSELLGGYLSKYMVKAFFDPRLYMKKAYVCSRNIKRPVIERNAIVIASIYKYELSTVEPSVTMRYMTQWLGECIFTLYKLNNRI